MKRIPLTVICTLLMFGLSACAAKTKDAKAKADEEQYVYLPPDTGSNLPRKVKLSELKSQQTGKQSSAVSGEDFQKSLRPGRQMDRDINASGR